MVVDRTRLFRLPGIHELNKDQDAALALPLEGTHLIIGGPGTGKSVVALLRVKSLADTNKKYRILVYNRLLEGSNRHLFGETQTLKSETWETWFRKLYKHILHAPAPTIEPSSSDNYRSLDWKTIQTTVQAHAGGQPINEEYFLVIDEGQDMPPVFYQVLVDWGLCNFYVVADQNQQIFPDKCSSRQDISDYLAIDNDDVVELKKNYRNSQPIALLAQHFYNDDPASPKPELPSPTESAQVPLLLNYDGPGKYSFAKIIASILYLSDRQPRKLIGILTPDNKIRLKFFDALRKSTLELDNGMPPIQTYCTGQKERLNFGTGGIMIINAKSCKGLEFDIVILADIDRFNPKRDISTLKSLFYVMVSRAREQVIMLRTGQRCPVVDSLLPTDHHIISRK